MGELVRKRSDKMIGPLEQSRNVADHDPIAGNSERADRVLLRRDHCEREARIVRQRIIVCDQIGLPVRHAAIGLDLIEDAQRESVALLAFGDEISGIGRTRFGEPGGAAELPNEPREVVDVPCGRFIIDDGLARKGPHGPAGGEGSLRSWYILRVPVRHRNGKFVTFDAN
jgi:hypothetical protein